MLRSLEIRLKSTLVRLEPCNTVGRMSSAPEGPQDAITGEEMAGTAVPGQPSTSYEASETHKRPNACMNDPYFLSQSSG